MLEVRFSTCFPEKEIITQKAGVIVILVPLYVEMYHTLGIFSEEAMGSHHPQTTSFVFAFEVSSGLKTGIARS